MQRSRRLRHDRRLGDDHFGLQVVTRNENVEWLTGNLALNDGEPFFNVDGTLGLDDQLRLDGQFKANSKGVVERLGPLVPDNVRPLVLGSPGADGTYSETINIRAGVVMSGIIPLALIPPLQ